MHHSPKTFGWKWPVILIVIAGELYTMYMFWKSLNVMILLALILASIVLGILLMRWEGSICWKRILYLERHNMPSTEEMRNGVLILFAGILMIIPGLITDVIGLLLFLPPVRWVVRKLFLKNLYFEIPAGFESQFQMYSFHANSHQEDQNYSSEEPPSNDIDDSRQEFDAAQNVQIIDVEATEPSQNSPDPESQNKGDVE